MPGMSKRVTGDEVEDSRAYRKARESAAEYADDKAKLDDLVGRASRKARARRGKLGEVRDSLAAMLRLLRAWGNGRYRDIPWSSLVSIIATVVYFVTPTDLIPDFLLGWGYIDDVALLTWVLGSVRADLDDFIAWETDQADPPAADGFPGD